MGIHYVFRYTHLEKGATLVDTKLDRFARSTVDAINTVKQLFERGVKVRILNMGLVENTPNGIKKKGDELMAVIDELKIIDGYFEGSRFLMRGINGYAVHDYYKADGIASFARLIDDNDPLTIVIDKECKIVVPVEMNKQIKKELFMIAEELEKLEG